LSRTPRSDLGPIPFSVTLEHTPRDADERGGPRPRVQGGILSALQGAHAAAYRGKWTLQFGDVPLKLKTHVDLHAVEELFVFLLELVDGGFGEWSVEDKGDLLVIEGDVHGADVSLEFGDGDGGPARFRRVQFPAKATVRLRALVDEGARLIRRLVTDASAADPDFAARPEFDELRADLDALLDAVAHLPRDWAPKKGAASLAVLPSP
jgi:hypothetical protein